MAQRGPVIVDLKWYEVDRAAGVGVTRLVEALRKGCNERLASPRDSWDAHILGALGECVVAKCLGRYWDGSVNTFKRGGDVGKVQVRTRSKHNYDLIVRDDDRDSDVFVLVTGGPASFVVHGWIFGRDAKKDMFLSNYGNYGPAYFVDQKSLHPIEEIPE